MRIFTAVRHSSDPRQFYGGLWSGNFYPALRELGHDIVESKVDLLPASRFMDVPAGFTPQENAVRADIAERILDEVRAAHRKSPVHLFLSYFYAAHFDPAGFDALRRLGIPSVNFYCNSIHQFDLVAPIAAKADVAWHAEKAARASYLAVGANPVWVQMGADPAVYRPSQAGVREQRACFVGQRYADRDRWLAALIGAKIPVDIFGHGWGDRPAEPSGERPGAEPDIYLGRRRPRAGGLRSYAAAAAAAVRRDGMTAGSRRIVRQWLHRRQTAALNDVLQANALGAVPIDRRIADVFGRYEICLNFSNVWADGRPGSALVPHIRLRDFEAPMCRSTYLTGDSEEIAEFYEIGREIETYRTPEELIDKTRFYLRDGAAAEALREAGYRRARRDHSWVRRFGQLFDAVFPRRESKRA